MKKPAYYLIALLFSILTACGGGTTEETNEAENQEESTDMNGLMEFDLSSYGMNLTIMIPDNSNGEPVVTENELGGVDIIVGKNFGISVVYGLGDLALLKADLNDDLVYESKIHQDDASLLVYEKNIPGSGVEPEFHFFYTTTVDGEIYDVQNTTANAFSKGAIDKMVASAKTLKGKTAS